MRKNTLFLIFYFAACVFCMLEANEDSTESPSESDMQTNEDFISSPESGTEAQSNKIIDVTLTDSIVTSTVGSPLQSDVVYIPGNITIIDSKEITKSPNTKITDIVKKTAGVRISNDVSFNPRPHITIRGISYGTLIMLDGIILSDLEGEARIINQISLDDVERVEIARGSHSSLYGTGAIGGVINFITDMPDKLETKLIAGYGSEFAENTADKNLVRVYGSLGDTFFDDRLKIKFSGSYKGSDGYSSFPTYLGSGDTTDLSGLSGYYVDKAGQTILGTGGNRNYNIYDTRLKISYDISQNDTIAAMVSFSGYDYRFDNFISYLRDSSGNVVSTIGDYDPFIGSGLGGMGEYQHLIGNVNYTHNFEHATLKIALSSVNLFSWWQDADTSSGATRGGGAGTTQDTDSSSNYLDFIYQHYLNNHIVSTAAQFRYYSYTQDSRNMTNWLDKNTRTDYIREFGSESFVASAYVNWEAQWIDELFSTNLGIRYDYWRNFNGYFYNYTNGENRSNTGDTQSIFSPKLSLNYTHLIFYFLKRVSAPLLECQPCETCINLRMQATIGQLTQISRKKALLVLTLAQN